MLSTIATVIATIGGVGLIVFLIWAAKSGHGERDEEEAARDFFSAHGHWPDEPPPVAER
jgi:hypothetical protein